MVRGAVVLIGDGIMKVDTQSHRTILVLLIMISPGPPPEAPLLPIAPQMHLLGFLSTYFGAGLGSWSQAVSWHGNGEVDAEESPRTRRPQGTFLPRALVLSMKEIVEMCGSAKLLQDL